MATFVAIVFEGIAYGSLLFLISVGLSVTMGLMNFVNLAHGAFAMFGGYLAVWLNGRWGIPFLATLPVVFLVVAAAGVILERVLYRRLYRASHLDQVLLTVGLVFVSMAVATYFWGPMQQSVRVPPALARQVHFLGLEIGGYRLFLVGMVVVIAVALRWLVAHTRFGAQVRASVDNAQVSEGLGIRVDRVFSLVFALGSGLAGIGGALGIEVLGLDPTFPLKYLVYFLLVVSVGGAGAMVGTALAAVTLGVFDVAGKYYVPAAGAFIIYALMVILLILFPVGLFKGAR
jgi:branched-chain amino acid transport system permease protein